MEKTINAILTYLDQTKAILASDRWSGVHKIDGVYRVHESSFIPAVMNKYPPGDVIAAEVAKFPNMKWDQQTLWLTISNHLIR